LKTGTLDGEYHSRSVFKVKRLKKPRLLWFVFFIGLIGQIMPFKAEAGIFAPVFLCGFCRF
jgi:hypothetical protein